MAETHDMQVRRKLDPRLQRILSLQAVPSAMEMARSHGEITAGSEGPVLAEAATKGLLVELNAGADPTTMAELRLRHVVDDIYSADVPLPLLGGMAERREVKTVEAGRRWYPMLDTALSESRADRVQAGGAGVSGRRGAGVVVGIIDFGLDYTLDDFRNADGSTRVAFLWDQSLTAGPGESVPPVFGYGVEYSRAEIDAALATPNPFAQVRHAPAEASHGTHVAAIAAGNGRSGDAASPAGRFVGAAPEATLIFVQPSTQGDGSFTDSQNVADAIAYVYARAEDLGLPCVVNMSLGQNGGSHDGESLVERAIDRMALPNGRAFVCAAGNEHIWRGHASGQLSAGQTRVLQWKIGGGMPIPSGGSTGPGLDRTPSEMEIWYSARDRLRVTVIDPDGVESAPLDPDSAAVFTDHNAATALFAVSDRFTPLNGESRVFIELSPRAPGPSVTRGVWQIRIEALEALDGRFDAWIERDLRDVDNNFADQSFFLGADFDPVMTLGTPATTRRGVAVANYDHRIQAVNDSSSRGPTRSSQSKPEVAAPGSGIVAAAARGGRQRPDGSLIPMRVAKTGTSMAAPHVAGIVALLLEEAPDLSSAQITAILKASADNPEGEDAFDTAWGFGRVNAQRAMALLRNPNRPGQGTGSS